MVSPEGRVFGRPGNRQALTSFLHHSDWQLRALNCSPPRRNSRANAMRLTRRRMAMPWERVAKSYRFEGPKGALSLPDLFDGRSQLIVYHFMFAPDWKEGCKQCSF